MTDLNSRQLIITIAQIACIVLSVLYLLFLLSTFLLSLFCKRPVTFLSSIYLHRAQCSGMLFLIVMFIGVTIPA